MCNPTDTGANVVVAAVLKNLPVQKHAFIGLQLPLIKQTILNRHQAANAARSCCDCNPSDGEERLHRRKTISNGNWRLRFSKQSYLLVRIQKIPELYEECCACFFPMQKDSASFGNPLDLEQADQLLQDIETASPPNPSAKSPASFLFATESFWYTCQQSDPSLFQIMPDCELKAFQSESQRMQHRHGLNFMEALSKY